LLVLGIAGILAFNYPALMPAFAGEELRQGAQGLGLLYSALGVGAISGALALASFGDRLPRARLFWGGAVSFCVLQMVFSFTRTLPLAMVTLAVMGLCMILFVADANTLIQSIVPDHLRGRVMGVYALVFLGSTPFGSLLAGLVANHWRSVPLALAGGSVLALLGIAAVWWLRPEARSLQGQSPGDEDEITAQSADGVTTMQPPSSAAKVPPDGQDRALAAR
jgi:MFS family permease